MLLALTHRGPEARDLGYLLHKHPDRVHTHVLAFGVATVFYPPSGEEECTAVLQVEVDPVGLVRSQGARQGDWALGQYVNDRPYVASSFLSVAMARVFGTALNGRCEKRPELVDKPLDLEIQVPVVAAPGGAGQLERLFVPLGYAVKTTPLPLDPNFPDWGEGRHASLQLKATRPLHEVLKHLFVLLPALDRKKHYWVGGEEVEKLLAKGEGWLAGHPEKEWIARRYLKFQHALTREALQRLLETDAGSPDTGDVTEDEARVSPAGGEAESMVPIDPVEATRVSLHEQRLRAVVERLANENPQSVLDLGCGEGKLLIRLLRETKIPRVTGMDVSSQILDVARERVARQASRKGMADRLRLVQGSLLYRDARLNGHEAAALVEVIEHLEPGRLPALARVVFRHLRPRLVIVTTPNREYNILFPGMPEGALRHRDHRFEWSREEFRTWAENIASSHGYALELSGVGECDPAVGPPSQMAVFRLADQPSNGEDGNED
jgi:3' terminal RNA ribose 2'-O-methyltransferase Hen1